MRSIIPFLFILACQETATKAPIPGTLPTDGESFAKVNNVPLSKKTIDAIMNRIPAGKKEELMAQGVLSQMQDQLITTELIYQKAIADKLHETEESKITMALAQREVLVNAYIQKELDARLTDVKLQEAYNERLVQYQKTEADMSMIMVSEEALATKLKGEIDGGADFAALAKEHSEDPKAKATTTVSTGSLFTFLPMPLETGFPESVLFGSGLGFFDSLALKVNLLKKETNEEIKKGALGPFSF